MPEARILIVDDDPEIPELVAAALRGEGFTLETAASAAEGIEKASATKFDLLILDVNLGDANGFQVRDRVRALPGMEQLPVVFLSGADARVEAAIARHLGTDKLLVKPLPRAELKRGVYAALKLVRVERGALPDALDRILYVVAENDETGILTAVRGGLTKRIVFQEGRIVFTSSNDPRDLIGQALLRAGLIGEDDLLQAFAASDPKAAAQPGVPRLASALAAMRKVTPEQCQKVFESKIRESVLDVFLWSGGQVEYVAGGVENGDMPFPLSLSIQTIRTDGMKRRRRWEEVRRIIPDFATTFERVTPWPEGFPKTGGDIAVSQLLERGLSLETMLVELRGQDYAVGVRVADLVQRGVLRAAGKKGFAGAPQTEPGAEPVSEIPSGEFTGRFPPVTPEQAAAIAESARPQAVPAPAEGLARAEGAAADAGVAAMLEAAFAFMQDSRPAEARRALLEVLEREPMNSLARQRLQEAETAIVDRARAFGLKDDTTLRLAQSISVLMGRQVQASEAFVLSRFAAGAMTVGSLLQVCPVPPHEILSILQKFVTDGTLKKS